MNTSALTTGTLVLFALSSTLVVVSGAHLSSRITIQIPFHLHDPHSLDHVQADFGVTKPVGSIAAYLYYAPHPICSEEFNRTDILPQHDLLQQQQPFILMALDGDCSAVMKARNAQRAGASALVIAQQHCRCSDKNCTSAFGPDCRDEEPVLVDDGSAADVSIPSFLLYRTIATAIQAEVAKGQSVLLELTWGISTGTIDKPVSYELWTDGHDDLVDYITYRHFQMVGSAFNDSVAQFAPRFQLIDGKRFKCNEQVQEDGPCDHLCTNHGRYCAIHATNLSGHAIVKETLRRLCIWQHAPANYWDYLLYHRLNCQDAHQFVGDECVSQALAHATIAAAQITECMSSTGNVDQDVENSLLQEQLALAASSGVVSVPAIRFNHRVSDHLSSFGLFEAICTHFWMIGGLSVPEICLTCGACSNKIGCIEEGHCVDFTYKEKDANLVPKKGQSKKHHGWKIFMFLLLGCCACGGAWLYFKQRDEFGGNNPFSGSYLQLGGHD